MSSALRPPNRRVSRHTFARLWADWASGPEKWLEIAVPALIIALPLWALGFLVLGWLKSDDANERSVTELHAHAVAQSIEAAASASLDAKAQEIFAKIAAHSQEANSVAELRQLIYAGEISYILIRRGTQTIFPSDEEWALPKIGDRRRQLLSIATDLYSRSDPPQGWYADISGNIYFRCAPIETEIVCLALDEPMVRPDMIAALNTAAQQAPEWSFRLRDAYNHLFWGNEPHAGALALSFPWRGGFRGWTLELTGAAPAKTSPARFLALGAPLAVFWIYFVWTQSRRHLEKLEQIESRKSFLARIAHDLRTPLANLTLFCELIRQETIGNDKAEAHCAVLAAELERLDHLAANAMAFGQSVSPRLSRAIPDERVNDLLERFESRFATVGTVCTIVAGETSQLRFDVAAFDRILVNLLDNTCKFAPGPMRLGTWFERGQLRLELSDSGPGLAPDYATAPSGSGLGLAIVRDLAEASGGDLSLSNGQDGLRVIVTLRAEFCEGNAFDAADS